MEITQTTPLNCRILNNSPALHSLKRQQLVQLCKRNGVKASGKSVDLIERLKAHASDMSDSCMSPGGDEDKENKRMPLARASETWSVIEEDSREVKSMRLGLRNIQEEVEQEMLTQSTLKGFGTSSFSESNSGSTNSKGSTITSSFRAFANTFKKAGNKMSTDPNQVTLGSSIEGEEPNTRQLPSEITTPVQTRPSPLPSPAPEDDNDSRDPSIAELGQSTIRLVSSNPTVPSPPALRPFPTFEACYSPESQASPFRHPTAFEEPPLPGAFPGIVQMPFKPPLHSSPAPPPFIFGSPAHQISNNQFHSVAASVLADMNARLGLTGTSNEVGLDLLEKKNTLVSASEPLFSQLDKPKTDVTVKFDKAHDRQFQQMEGIGDWYARKYGNLPTHNLPTAQEGILNRKRKSDALAGTSRRIVRPSTGNGRRVSKGQAPSKDIGDPSEERQAKRLRVSLVDNPEVIQRQASAGESKAVGMEVDEDPKAQEEREKERAAIKKKLEVSRARRRSSMGRVSVGANKPALIPNQPKKGTTSKFGFLSSAKNLVRNVWNRGIGAGSNQQPKPVVPARVVSSGIQKKEGPAARKLSNNPGQAAKLSISGAAAKQNGPSVKKPSISFASTNGTTSTTIKSRTGTASSTTSGGPRRAAIPSFSRLTAKNPTDQRVSSTSIDGTGPLQGGTAIRKSGSLPNGNNARTSGAGDSSVNSVARKRASTLLAPTASSLARMQHTAKQTSSLSARPPGHGPPPMTKSFVPVPALTPSRIPILFSPQLTSDNNGATTVATVGKLSESIFSNGPPNFPPSKPGPANEAAKTRPLPGRRPRISRSRVIARVGAQRIASTPAPVVSANGRRSLNTPKTRGSLGVKVSGIGNKAQIRESFTANHRKRLRQSEVIRRRSRVSAIGTAIGKSEDSSEERCDVDGE